MAQPGSVDLADSRVLSPRPPRSGGRQAPAVPPALRAFADPMLCACCNALLRAHVSAAPRQLQRAMHLLTAMTECVSPSPPLHRVPTHHGLCCLAKDKETAEASTPRPHSPLHLSLCYALSAGCSDAVSASRRTLAIAHDTCSATSAVEAVLPLVLISPQCCPY
jgi:hypothetical protein